MIKFLKTLTNLIFLCATHNVEEEIDIASIHTSETLEHYDFR